jgi:hypothetical protein
MTEAGGGAAEDGEGQGHGQQNDGVTSGWWREKEPALTWVKFDLNKNYECNRGNC